MHPQAVLEKLALVENHGAAFRYTTRPNNPQFGFDYDKAFQAAEAALTLRELEAFELVPQAEKIQRDLKLPALDYSTADRDALLFKIQCQEFYSSLGDLINQASIYEGYNDPEIEVKLFREQLRRIDIETQSLRSDVKDIREIVKSIGTDKQSSGVAISLGVISADLSAIEKFTFATIDLIRDKTEIPTAVFLFNLRSTRRYAIDLASKLRDSIEHTGRRASEIALSVFKAATSTLRQGLEIARRVLRDKVDHYDEGYTKQSEIVSRILDDALTRGGHLGGDVIKIDNYVARLQSEFDRYELIAFPEFNNKNSLNVELTRDEYYTLIRIPATRFNEILTDHLIAQAVDGQGHDALPSESGFGRFF